MYRVLARKYRPQTFADLIGQEAMVRTLTNAINTNRLAHAFVLTGVRGVGKTTTARILAKAFNCIGADGSGTAASPEPCGACSNCLAISEDRHVDVIELDAASHTGVDNMRELIDGVRYKPAIARYKVYIIDEVHMLSRSAFNALLKTLEEPPEHVKFLFATTEIHKLPATILSRCQRYDLPRVTLQQLAEHLVRISEKEQVRLEETAALALARAAEGSVRDSLSILDQAIALAGDAAITEDMVHGMLGMVDDQHMLQIFRQLLHGDIQAVLATTNDLIHTGAEPLMLTKELLRITHLVSRLKIDAAALPVGTVSDAVRSDLLDMAEKLSVPVLTRTWQILLKGVEEIKLADNAPMALDMVLIRLAYVRDLPTLDQLPHPEQKTPPPSPGGGGMRIVTSSSNTAPQLAVQSAPAPLPLQDFTAVISLFEEKREASIAYHLKQHVRLIAMRPGHLELVMLDGAPRDLANSVGKLLTQWTENRWLVSIADAGLEARGEATVREQRDAAQAARIEAIRAEPLVAKAMELFQGAVLQVE